MNGNVGKKYEASRLRVLILEDEPNDAELIQHHLKKAGYQAEFKVSESRLGFIRDLLQMVPHIVIADYGLVGFTGRDALSFVRRVFPDIPFLFVSGHPEKTLHQQLLGEGATLFLEKKHMNQIPTYFSEAFELHPNSEVSLLSMKVQNHIRENLEGLDEMRTFLGEGRGQLSCDLLAEIDQSISYLKGLSKDLRG